MSTYRLGLSDNRVLLPSHPVFVQTIGNVSDVRAGVSMVRSGEDVFYRAGVTGRRERRGGLAGLLDLALDIFRAIVVVAGLFLTWTALRALCSLGAGA